MSGAPQAVAYVCVQPGPAGAAEATGHVDNCVRKAATVDAELSGHFVDEAGSLRPALRRMLQAASGEAVRYVVVPSIHHLGRNPTDVESIERALQQAGVVVLCCDGSSPDTSDDVLRVNMERLIASLLRPSAQTNRSLS